MANCESYLLGSIQISTICFPFSNNFNALPRSTMQARANDVLMMSNRPLLRSVSACALPFQHAWRCHLCQAKIRGNSRKCVLHWALRLTASASYTGVLLYTSCRLIFSKSIATKPQQKFCTADFSGLISLAGMHTPYGGMQGCLLGRRACKLHTQECTAQGHIRMDEQWDLQTLYRFNFKQLAPASTRSAKQLAGSYLGRTPLPTLRTGRRRLFVNYHEQWSGSTIGNETDWDFSCHGQWLGSCLVTVTSSGSLSMTISWKLRIMFLNKLRPLLSKSETIFYSIHGHKKLNCGVWITILINGIIMG